MVLLLLQSLWDTARACRIITATRLLAALGSREEAEMKFSVFSGGTRHHYRYVQKDTTCRWKLKIAFRLMYLHKNDVRKFSIEIWFCFVQNSMRIRDARHLSILFCAEKRVLAKKT